MNEENQETSGSGQPIEESEVLELLKQIRQQMTYLEKKMDLLLGQAPQKSFNREGASFSRPPRRPFGDAPRHGGKGHFGSHRSGGFSHGRPSYDRPREGGFSGERKPFSHERPSFDRGHSADRPQASGNTNYKPFPSKERFFGKKRERKHS